METKNMADENFARLSAMFPNAVTETINENGEIVRAIDKDVLMQEINGQVVEGREERYQFTWPDKKASIVKANEPINKTLRPCAEESVDFDTTENLYIEGDNLEVLKLLQETYLGKVKMIYIDPPYNTGNDFVYNDTFKMNQEEWDEVNGEHDEYGNRLVKNLDSNGRFHTDWLNMIYPRLKIARDLLADDGVIFISIDDYEIENLKKVCDEIFGRVNFIGNFIRKTSAGEKTAKPKINRHHDYVIAFARNIKVIQDNEVVKGYEKTFSEYSNPDNDKNGEWKKDSYLIKIDNGRFGHARYGITNPYLGITHYPPVYFNEQDRKQWHYVEDTFNKMVTEGRVVFHKSKDEYTGEYSFYIKKYKKEISDKYNNLSTLNYCDNNYTNANGTKNLSKIFHKGEFDNIYPKPISLVSDLISHVYNKGQTAPFIMIDFFSGSGTSAEAVMRFNTEFNADVKFILAQIPDEPIGESIYKNICEIGKERIRRAGNKIKNEIEENNNNLKLGEEPKKVPDIGFRVLKVDSSNMKDVFYNPVDMEQGNIFGTVDNIKEDRTHKDLLFQAMLELGVALSKDIKEENIGCKTVYTVDGIYLMACFDSNITEDIITEIAKRKPYFFVMRDSGFASDSVAVNIDQIFESYSKETVRKVL